LFGVSADESSGLRKHLLDRLEATQVETRAVPFRAAYVLNPVTDLSTGVPASRQRLDAVAATIALVMHSKLGPVLTGAESPVVLSQAAEIARSVPVYELSVIRDLERIDEVAQLLINWHAGEVDPAGRNG
jgi:hypothetical protein